MISVAVYNDFIGSDSTTPQEEAEEIVDRLGEYLMDFVYLKYHSTIFDPNMRAGIVVLDYGGAMSLNYDYAKNATSSFLDYLDKNPSTLGIVWSAFNRGLVESEFALEFGQLPNLIFRYADARNWDMDYSKEEELFKKDLSQWFQLKPENMTVVENAPIVEEIVESEIAILPTVEHRVRKKRLVTDYPFIEFKVRAYDTTAIHFPDLLEGEKEGLMVFKAFCTDVRDDDKELGSISGGTGAVVISIVNGGYFMINHDDLWYALQKALKGKKTLAKDEDMEQVGDAK